MKKSIGKVLMGIGLLLVLAAAGLLAYNTRESSRAGQAASRILTQLTEEMPQAETPQTETRSEESEPAILREMTVKTVDGLDYIGYLSIPELALELPVQAQWSYDGLQKSPGRFSGSTFSDDLTICAHNYPAHFGRLRNLSQGEEIDFTDMDGMVWIYEVSYVTVLEPEDVEQMTDKDPEDTWGVPLFTCTPGGAERVAVRCHRTGLVAKE